MTRFNTQLVHGLPVNDNNTGAVNPPTTKRLMPLFPGLRQGTRAWLSGEGRVFRSSYQSVAAGQQCDEDC